ncbi:hypothetical protein CPC08DRAFT_759756 [Agrocybe pediades]|nr:hypothetical protein CPC08DRAFT_759756 [Agrocybe pediades]
MQPPHSTPMITSDRGVLITGGQFNQYNYHGQASLGNKELIDLLREAVAPSAFHDSGAVFDKPKCHPRTRVKIREIIMRWIELGKDKDDQAGKQFMWLNGAAGCGKSAIAQSIIETCIERCLPLASFFFSKSDSTRNHAGSLIATLAYQLYCAFPETTVQAEILSAIKKDTLIFKKTIQQQFTSLIIRPLMTHFSKGPSAQLHQVPFLIVIDGLDECIDRNAQKAILTDLAESLRNSNLRIPIFVASRPEHEIKLSFGSKYLGDMHTTLSLDIEDEDNVDADIRLYLFDRFAKIKDDYDNLTAGRKLAQDWPGDDVIKMLVRKSSRQFIYAATVIRYVESTRHRPDHRLDIILNLRPVNGDQPFAQLDSLYAMILESVLDIEKVLHVLSLCLMNGPRIQCHVIERLLLYDEGEVELLFCDMGALVQISGPTVLFHPRHQEYVPEHSSPFLHILHASLRDYLLDATRSKQFHIDMYYEYVRHLTHALQYLASCCSSSFNPNSNVGVPVYILRSIQSRIGRCNGRSTISLELRQSVLSFPIKEFLEPHTGTCTYSQLLEYFVDPFMEILKIMVLDDPTSFHIQDCQLGILRTVLMQQLQRYFKDDRLALVLVLFYHVGSHRFVPILEPSRLSLYSYSTLFNPEPGFDERDMLSLSRIWDHSTRSFSFRDNVYHRFMRQLLRDPCPTSKYALGPVMHERAALACFRELARTVPLLPPPSGTGKNIVIGHVKDDAEEDAYPKLIFDPANGGQWQFKYSGQFKVQDEELYFVLLGYLIFLLPRCGRSAALVAACEEHNQMSYIEQPDGPFPIRRKLLHQEVNTYLARVLSTLCILEYEPKI